MNNLGDFNILPVPEEEDDLETTARKLKALADVVNKGNSLALWTGMKGASNNSKKAAQPQDIESNARTQMSPQERTAYDAWKADHGKNVARFNFEENTAGIPKGAQSHKKFTLRAAGMDRIWGRTGAKGKSRATPENASWLTFNMPAVLPLVNAVTRVMKAERHHAEQQEQMKGQDSNTNAAAHGGLSEMEVVELETVRKIVAAGERNRTRELERIRKLTRSITEDAEVLKGRIQYYLHDRGGGSGSSGSGNYVLGSDTTIKITEATGKGEKRKQIDLEHADPAQ